MKTSFLFSKSFIVLLFGLSVLISSCGGGYKKTASGVEYKIVVDNKNGKKAKEGEYIQLHFVRLLEDSIVYSTYKEQPQMILYQKVNSKAGEYNIFDIFSMVKEGDSVLTRVPYDALFKEPTQRPPFYKKNGYARLYFKVLKIMSEEEKQKFEMAAYQKQVLADKNVISSFVATNRLSGQFNEHNVWINTIRQGNGKAIDTGNVVDFLYTGRLLNGVIFDSNLDTNFTKQNKGKVLSVKVGKNQIIPGLDLSLKGIKKNSVVRFIIPSSLAYGNNGVSNVIPPNSVLDFEIHVVNVK